MEKKKIIHTVIKASSRIKIEQLTIYSISNELTASTDKPKSAPKGAVPPPPGVPQGAVPSPPGVPKGAVSPPSGVPQEAVPSPVVKGIQSVFCIVTNFRGIQLS